MQGKKEDSIENASEISDYSKDIEDLFISFMMSNPELYVRCKSILKPKYFDNVQNRDTVAFIESYSTSYSSLPTLLQIKSVTQKDITYIPDDAAKHDRWFLKEIESFCRHKALRDAILESPAKLDEGRYGEVLVAVKDAVQIALVKDLGTDYYADPKSRLEAVRDSNGQISTGWKDVDAKLYGGLNRGEITVFCGQSGSGKSIFLQNLAVTWAQASLNVVYLSLELSEKLCSMRIDSMHTGYDGKEIMRNIDDVHMKVRATAQKSKGSLRIKQMPNGCTTNDIRAYIKEYEIQSGIKIDALLVDYLDLMSPIGKKISAENLFVKDKYITEELRNLAVELDILCCTASQLGRQSYSEIDFDPSHIAGGISKINTADNVIAIFTTSSMREAGRYQVQFMKTRSSSGVGSKVDLSFDNKSLRVADLDESATSTGNLVTKTLYDQIKNRSVTTSKKPDTETTQISDSASVNLRDFLKRNNNK